jgi:hypothetical protein
MDGADSAFGSVEERVDVVGVSPSPTFRRRPVNSDAGEAGEGPVSSSANQMSPPSALIKTRWLLNGARGGSDGDFGPVFARHVAYVGRAAIGLHPEQFLKSTNPSPEARLVLVASISAFDDDGMPHRCDELRPAALERTINCLVIRKTPGIGAGLLTYQLITRNSDDGCLVGGDE